MLMPRSGSACAARCLQAKAPVDQVLPPMPTRQLAATLMVWSPWVIVSSCSSAASTAASTAADIDGWQRCFSDLLLLSAFDACCGVYREIVEERPKTIS